MFGKLLPTTGTKNRRQKKIDRTRVKHGERYLMVMPFDEKIDYFLSCENWRHQRDY